jgi:hypothetical protein
MAHWVTGFPKASCVRAPDIRYGTKSRSTDRLEDPAQHPVMGSKSINHAWQSLSSKMPRADSWGFKNGSWMSSL